MKKAKWFKVFLISVGVLFLAVLLLPESVFPQSMPDTARVDFDMGSSEVKECYLPRLYNLGNRLKVDDTVDYRVMVSVDSVGWLTDKQIFKKVTNLIQVLSAHSLYYLKETSQPQDSLHRYALKDSMFITPPHGSRYYLEETSQPQDTLYRYTLKDSIVSDITAYEYEYYAPDKKKKTYYEKEESDVRNAALLLSRPRAVFIVMGMPLELSKVVFVEEQKERYVKVVIFEKSTDFEDFKSKTEQGLEKVSGQLVKHESRIENLEKRKSSHNWSLIAGWHGVSFGTEDFVSRDLRTPMAGVRFSYESYFVQIVGGLNPWSFQGYRGYWYRDVLGTAMLGCNFRKSGQWTLSAQVGGLIGWECTSETNEFDFQALCLVIPLAGMTAEYKFNEDLSVGFSANFVHAETSDMTAESGDMRSGIYFSAYLKLF